jgi:hypothetical protein
MHVVSSRILFLLFLVPPNERSERSGLIRARAADCLTEPGIVWETVAESSACRRDIHGATVCHYEAGEGVSAVLAFPALRLNANAQKPDVTVNLNQLSSLLRPAQRAIRVFRADPGKGRRLSD